MRDPQRIPEIIERLRVFWEAHPDWRLGQLIMNIYTERYVDGYFSHLFNVEDDELMQCFDRLERRLRFNP